MKKGNEKQEQAGLLTPVFGVAYDLSQPDQLKTAIEKAEKEKEKAKEYLQHSRKFYNHCTLLVDFLKSNVNLYGKEAING